MDDRNRRDERSRRSRSPSFDEDFDPYPSRQAEQFEDSSSYDQDQWSREHRGSQQMGDTRRQSDRGGFDDTPWRDRSQQSGRDRLDRFALRERNFGGASFDQGDRDFPRQRDRGSNYADRERHPEHDRGFMDRAGDEIASWFGDEEAARRRQMDHRGSGPANYTRSDERILEDVCDCLTEDWQLDARNVQVTVAGGEVTLDGTVDDRGAKRRAEDIVENISGVGHVQNNLRVKPRDMTGTGTIAQ